MLKRARHAKHMTVSALVALTLMASACVASASKPATASLPEGASADLIAAGDKIFHGTTCFACHGAGAKGTSVGPDLTDAIWLTGDGSIAAITTIIDQGVDEPKQFSSPMPAAGGANLSAEDLKTVAAYVWSLSHK
jgi:cbb3-type cytochrome c oxidase subunit III